MKGANEPMARKRIKLLKTRGLTKLTVSNHRDVQKDRGAGVMTIDPLHKLENSVV